MNVEAVGAYSSYGCKSLGASETATGKMMEINLVWKMVVYKNKKRNNL